MSYLGIINRRKIVEAARSTDRSFGVAIDGIYLFTTTAPGNYSWQNFSFSYTAASSSVVLSLSSQINGTGISYAIDNISSKSVPEPGIASLCIFSIGVLMLCRRIPRPNKSPEPTAIAACGQSVTPVAHRVSGSGRLSFFRQTTRRMNVLKTITHFLFLMVMLGLGITSKSRCTDFHKSL